MESIIKNKNTIEFFNIKYIKHLWIWLENGSNLVQYTKFRVVELNCQSNLLIISVMVEYLVLLDVHMIFIGNRLKHLKTQQK